MISNVSGSRDSMINDGKAWISNLDSGLEINYIGPSVCVCVCRVVDPVYKIDHFQIRPVIKTEPGSYRSLDRPERITVGLIFIPNYFFKKD